MEERNWLINTRFTKTVLMILVVLCHSADFWTGNWFTKNPMIQSKTIGIMAEIIGSFHIYCFVLVSGYIFYYKYSNGGYRKYREFIKTKIQRLIVPYVFVSIIWVAPIACLFFKFNVIQVFRNFVLAEAPNQLWFLWMLFGVFLVYWPLADYFQDKNILGVILAASFFGVGTIGDYFFPNYFQIWTAFKYIVFFWIGTKIRQYEYKIYDKRCGTLMITVFIFLFIIKFFLMQKCDGFIASFINIGMGLLININGAIGAFYILQNLADNIKWRDNRLFTFISKKTMPMYLFHQQIIYFIIYYFNGKINPFIHMTLSFFAAISFSLLISIILSSFKTTRVLLGEKN